MECLRAEGVDRVFGIPGEENLDIMDDIHSAGLEFVLTRHEQAAAFMAATVGRLTGRPGVCLSTLGPGATNLVSGVADAYLSNCRWWPWWPRPGRPGVIPPRNRCLTCWPCSVLSPRRPWTWGALMTFPSRSGRRSGPPRRKGAVR